MSVAYHMGWGVCFLVFAIADLVAPGGPSFVLLACNCGMFTYHFWKAWEAR